jgi:hypothetical protein
VCLPFDLGWRLIDPVALPIHWSRDGYESTHFAESCYGQLCLHLHAGLGWAVLLVIWLVVGKFTCLPCSWLLPFAPGRGTQLLVSFILVAGARLAGLCLALHVVILFAGWPLWVVLSRNKTNKSLPGMIEGWGRSCPVSVRWLWALPEQGYFFYSYKVQALFLIFSSHYLSRLLLVPSPGLLICPPFLVATYLKFYFWFVEMQECGVCLQSAILPYPFYVLFCLGKGCTT